MPLRALMLAPRFGGCCFEPRLTKPLSMMQRSAGGLRRWARASVSVFSLEAGSIAHARISVGARLGAAFMRFTVYSYAGRSDRMAATAFPTGA